MILGTGPTQQNPVDFTPPTPGGGNIPSLPKTGFYSGNIWPFSQVMGRMHAFPAWRPGPPNNVGLQPLPPISPPTPAAAPAAPAPGPTPSGTAGAFGGSGFGSSGGVRAHSHVDPYRVMRSGMIPGVSPNGSNIRAGVANVSMRVQNSMPFQSHPLAPDMPAPMPMPAALPSAPMPMPATTHGFGAFSWNPLKWFRSRGHSHMVATQAHMQGFGASCEMVGPRLDGTRVLICGGRVMMVIDREGNVLRNAYSNADAY